ncbi:uncharacterized protein [Anabrus simplex]|uniref:uncharacterized protein n=1 Tax=Anabrus simplex TaxID=316456 RepID=UPI0034DCF9FD
MAAAEDPTCLSLDDIIKMNRSRANSRAPSVAGSVKSFRSQRSNGRQQNRVMFGNNRAGQPARRFNPYQGQIVRPRQYPFWRNYQQPRRRNLSQLFAQQRVRRAARFLNMYPGRRSMYQQQQYRFAVPRWRQPRRPLYRFMTQTRPLLSIFGPNLARLTKLEMSRRRFEQSRMAEQPGDQDDAASVLTVSVANDLYQQRQRNGLPPLVDKRASRRNVGNLNKANVARHNAAMARPNARSISPSGSVVTTVSKRSQKSARRNRQRQLKRSRSRSRARSMAAANGLNPEIQRAIATIQGKTFAEDDASFSQPTAGPSNIGPVHRPTPYATGVSLHDRFTCRPSVQWEVA